MSSSEEEVSTVHVSKERAFSLTPPVYAPSFYIPHGNNYQNQTFCIPSDRSSHLRSVPELRGMKCHGSWYGWLILHNHLSHKFYLFNPVTLHKIHLPALPPDTFDVVALTYPPSDPKCVIMLLSEKKKVCIFSRVGDRTWIKQEVRDTKGDLLMDKYNRAVSSKGKIYLFFLERVAVIDARDKIACIEVYQTIFLPGSMPSGTRFGSYYLESCGDFFQICLGSSDSVQKCVVFKLDFSKMIWENVESLGNRVFLLGKYTNSVSLAASKFGAKGNCIYFFAGSRTELHIFDMDNHTITITQLCPTNFLQQGGPFWVVPSCNALMKKEVTEVKEEIQLTSSNLLPELLEMIFRFLHSGSIIQFRLARKGFISVNPPIRSFHPEALSNSQHIPWLISFPYSKSDVCHFYHPIYIDVYTMDLPQLRGAIVRHAKFGWLLMSRGKNCLFFFNPLTLETINLPEEPRYDGFMNVSFSSPPTSSDYVVFGIKASHKSFVLMSAYRKVQDRWSLHFLRNLPYTFSPSHCNPVFHNGVFYSLSKDGKLGIFNPNVTKVDDMWRVYTDLVVQDVTVSSSLLVLEDSTRRFIMECDGRIFFVHVGFVGSPVCVYTFDESEEKIKWLKVETLGDRVFFLSHTTSLVLPAVLKGTENRIYFPRFKGKSSVFYSLSSGKYHNCREQEPRSDWTDTTEHLNCSWFILNTPPSPNKLV